MGIFCALSVAILGVETTRSPMLLMLRGDLLSRPFSSPRRMQGLSEVENLAKILPFVEDMAEQDPNLTSLVTAYIPVIVLLVLINTLYFILKVL